MICPRCQAHNDAVTSMYEEGAVPEAGDVSICFRCGHLGMFTGVGVEVRDPTGEERDRLMADEGVRRALHAVMARNINEAADRTRFPCGCRMATHAGIFYFLPCSATCDKYAYAVEQGRKLGRPIDVVQLPL